MTGWIQIVMSAEKKVMRQEKNKFPHHSSLSSQHLEKELVIALLPSKRSPIPAATCVTQAPQPA